MSERLERIQQNDLLRAINDISLYGPEGIRMEAVIKDIEWLIKQTERYEDLLEQVKQIEKVSDYNADLRMKYEKALEFYANKENYSPDFSHNVDNDKGEIARQALGAED